MLKGGGGSGGVKTDTGNHVSGVAEVDVRVTDHLVHVVVLVC